MKLLLIGTGTPNAEPARSGPAVAVIEGDSVYLVDAGPGVVRRAVEAFSHNNIEFNVSCLDKLFLTHLHSDHTAGYPDVILTPWVLNREKHLRVFGPAGTREMTDHILAGYSRDIDERINGLQPSNITGIKVAVTEIKPGLIHRDYKLTVEAFQVNHGGMESYAYKFTSSDRIIVISGDTALVSEFEEFCYGADVLVHEVYSSTGFKNYPADWQAYHSSVHTSSEELAEMASCVKPSTLVLYHQLYNGASDLELLYEISRIYDGKVISGKDFDLF